MLFFVYGLLLQLLALLTLGLMKLIGVEFAYRSGVPLGTFELDSLPTKPPDWLRFTRKERAILISERLGRFPTWQSFWTQNFPDKVMAVARQTEGRWVLRVWSSPFPTSMWLTFAMIATICVSAVVVESPGVQNEGPIPFLAMAAFWLGSIVFFYRRARVRAGKLADALGG